jgi:ABC-type branched-subunit amino acid transport system substrate-binding protein
VSCKKKETISSSDQKVVKIGVISVFSGQYSDFGDYTKKTLNWQLSRLQNPKLKYEVIYEDDQYKRTQTLLAAKKLIEVDKVDILVSSYDIAADLTAPLTQKAGVIQIGYCRLMDRPQNPLTFWFSADYQQTVPLYVEELKKRNVKKLGVVRIKHIFAEDAMNVLRPLLKKENIEIVFDEAFSPTERMFNDLISKISAQKDKVDETLLLSFSPSAEVIADQLKRHGLKNISAIESFDYCDDIKPFNGSWYVSCINLDPAFVEESKKSIKNATEMQQSIIAFTADMVMPFIDGYEKNSEKGKPSRETVANYVRNLGTVRGACNELEYRQTGAICAKPLIKKVVDGKGVIIK